MTWEILILTYLAMGLLFSWISNEGHRELYGISFSWQAWVAGTIGWLPALFIAGWRKK